MKNILILNMNTSHDLISSTHLIASYKKENPDTNIEVVTLSAFKGISHIINHVSKFHFIDTNLIQNIITNPLYSDAFAINQFTEVIGPISEKKWDTIINYSNDNISSYLMNAIQSEEKVGTFINQNGLPRNTNNWSIYQNMVASGLKRQSIDKVSVRNHMNGLPVHHDVTKIKSHTDYSIVATRNFSRIREMNQSAATFVVGINLESGYDSYTIALDTYVDLIDAMEDSGDFKPVLLLSGKNYQRQIANDLNKRFNNKLISINVDTIAVPSVIANLDAIISTSNDQLAIADAMEVKAFEIRDFNGGTYTPTLVGSDNYVIYTKEERTLASDLLLAINEAFGTELPIDFMNSVNPVYKSVQDDYGIFFTQIRGSLNVTEELRYHIERSFMLQTMGYPKNTELFDHIRDNTEKDQKTKFVSELKSELTSVVKVLLGTLRSLKGVRASQQNLNSFINYLDTLISAGKNDSTVSAIIRCFEGRIENIDANDVDSNMKEIEKNLFSLKTDLQSLTTIMSDLTEEQQTESTHSVIQNKNNMEV